MIAFVEILGYSLHVPKGCVYIILRLERFTFAASVGGMWLHHLVVYEAGCVFAAI